ncbi:MAG: hypothetical protein HKN30_08950 [Sulfitobacter sp.]|nr:hypothetical protein [Sulfitobacter sp.]
MAFTPLLSRRGALAGALPLTIFGSAAAQQTGLKGVYRAEGRNPDGSAYNGTAVIAEQQGTWADGRALERLIPQ